MKPFRSKREKLEASNREIQLPRVGLRSSGETPGRLRPVRPRHVVPSEFAREDAILPLVGRHGALGGARGARRESVVPNSARSSRASEPGSTLSNRVESRAGSASPARARFGRRVGSGRNRLASIPFGLLAWDSGTAIDTHRPVAVMFGISRDPS